MRWAILFHLKVIKQCICDHTTAKEEDWESIWSHRKHSFCSFTSMSKPVPKTKLTVVITTKPCASQWAQKFPGVVVINRALKSLSSELLDTCSLCIPFSCIQGGLRDCTRHTVREMLCELITWYNNGHNNTWCSKIIHFQMKTLYVAPNPCITTAIGIPVSQQSVTTMKYWDKNIYG